MEDFTFRSDSIDVEKIMDEIRSRIREKRGVDYTEAQIRELAQVKLDKFLDPERVRSGLHQHYRGSQPPPRDLAFEDETLHATSPGLRGRLVFVTRRLMNPVLKVLFNPVLRKINAYNARLFETNALQYEVLNGLVVGLTRATIDTKNHRMRLESLASRLDSDERRARALEKVVQYRPGATALAEDATGKDAARGGDRAQRRRHRLRESRRSATAVDGDDDAD